MPRPSAGSRTRTVRATPKVVAQLAASDPVMARLIEEHRDVVRRDLRSERPGDAYGALLRSIVGQQLSTKAARTIYGRMLELFGGHPPTPKQLLAADPTRSAPPGCRGPRSTTCATSPTTSRAASSSWTAWTTCRTRR